MVEKPEAVPASASAAPAATLSPLHPIEG